MATTRIATVAFDLPQSVSRDKRYDTYIALTEAENLWSSDMENTPLPETTRWLKMRPGDTCQALFDRIKACIVRVTGYQPIRLMVCDGIDMVTFAQPEKLRIGGRYAGQFGTGDPPGGYADLLATPRTPSLYGDALALLLRDER